LHGFGQPEEVLSMKIAQIAPLAERCPPRFYGGTEHIVSYLTEELVRQGREVTLFASEDSLTAWGDGTGAISAWSGTALRRDALVALQSCASSFLPA